MNTLTGTAKAKGVHKPNANAPKFQIPRERH
jgi:hypothetical protein